MFQTEDEVNYVYIQTISSQTWHILIKKKNKNKTYYEHLYNVSSLIYGDVALSFSLSLSIYTFSHLGWTYWCPSRNCLNMYLDLVKIERYTIERLRLIEAIEAILLIEIKLI